MGLISSTQHLNSLEATGPPVPSPTVTLLDSLLSPHACVLPLLPLSSRCSLQPTAFSSLVCNTLFLPLLCLQHPCFAAGSVVTGTRPGSNRVQETHPWKDTAFFFFVIPLIGLVTPPGASGTSWARLSTPSGGSPASWISLDCQIVFTTTLAMARGGRSQGETHHLLCPPPGSQGPPDPGLGHKGPNHQVTGRGVRENSCWLRCPLQTSVDYAGPGSGSTTSSLQSGAHSGLGPNPAAGSGIRSQVIYLASCPPCLRPERHNRIVSNPFLGDLVFFGGLGHRVGKRNTQTKRCQH